MKTIAKSTLYVLFAAMIVMAIFAVPAAAQTQIPFKGTFQANDTDKSFTPPATIVVDTNGSGIGTVFGQLSFGQENTVDLSVGTETGSGHWVAANGDSIDTTIVGSGEFTDIPNVVRITEIDTITGGTGRFAGAQGSFTVERLANTVTFVTSGSFHGTITTPGSGQ